MYSEVHNLFGTQTCHMSQHTNLLLMVIDTGAAEAFKSGQAMKTVCEQSKQKFIGINID